MNFGLRLDKILGQITSKTADASYGEWQVVGLPEAKQAITSLMKELVAEAKPTNSETQRGSVTVYGDLSERDLNIINQFEQNLLKALEEV